MMGREGADFSFSGLKTAVRQVVQDDGPLDEGAKAALAADFQAAVVDVLTDRVGRQCSNSERSSEIRVGELPLVAAGGVAANRAIRAALQHLCERKDFRLPCRRIELCTDNGAMVAWAGLERFAERVKRSARHAPPRARWPLES